MARPTKPGASIHIRDLDIMNEECRAEIVEWLWHITNLVEREKSNFTPNFTARFIYSEGENQ